MSKQEAERLADALERDYEGTKAQPVIDLLRQWPDGEPCAWVMPSRPPQYFAPVLHMCSAPPEPLSLDEAIAQGWIPLYPAPPDSAARIAELEGALDKIDAIRNSIIGAQKVNWSEHIYPLVAALEGAGYRGQEYEVARENVGTLLERVSELERQRDALLTDEQKQEIHNATGAGHSLICLVESYIKAAGGGK